MQVRDEAHIAPLQLLLLPCLHVRASRTVLQRLLLPSLHVQHKSCVLLQRSCQEAPHPVLNGEPPSCLGVAGEDLEVVVVHHTTRLQGGGGQTSMHVMSLPTLAGYSGRGPTGMNAISGIGCSICQDICLPGVGARLKLNGIPEGYSQVT